jgi:hypothetical protein
VIIYTFKTHFYFNKYFVNYISWSLRSGYSFNYLKLKLNKNYKKIKKKLFTICLGGGVGGGMIFSIIVGSRATKGSDGGRSLITNGGGVGGVL